MGPARQRRGARDERRSWQVGLRFGALTRAERGVGAGARDGPLGSSASGRALLVGRRRGRRVGRCGCGPCGASEARACGLSCERGACWAAGKTGLPSGRGAAPAGPVLVAGPAWKRGSAGSGRAGREQAGLQHVLGWVGSSLFLLLIPFLFYF